MTGFISGLGAFVLMLGILIFIHELGHFLVAKMCGVRVLKFSLGFGPPVGFGRFRMAWHRGGTDYVVAWFPLGGFVKMLGENPDEADSEEVDADPEHALDRKPVWQKLAIVFAGPVMNLVLPIFVFTGTLFAGIDRPAPVIGNIERGAPAAEVGLSVGDRVLTVGGEEVTWWDDVRSHVRSAPGESVEFEVERDGARLRIVVPVAARTGLDEFGTVQTIGFAGIEHNRLRAMIGIPKADAPAATAGLRSGDRIQRVAETSVEDWSGLANAYAQVTGIAEVEVERGSGDSVESVVMQVPALGSLDALGVIPATALIQQVTPDSAADEAGLALGDLILAVDGNPVGSFASFAETVRSSKGRSLSIAYARAGENHVVEIQPRIDRVDTGLGIEEDRYLIGIAAQPAALIGAVAEDQERNPFVAVPRAVEMTVDTTRTFLRGLGKLVTGEVSRKQVGGPILIAEIAHNAFQRGWEAYLSVLVLISINLGILNLLPIPVLDGGQALIFAIEGIKRSPVSLRTREIAQQIGLTMLILLMGLAFWNDLARHWGSFVDFLRDRAGL